MDVKTPSEETLWTYFNLWWQELSPAARRRWWAALGLFAAIWLPGALVAPSLVPGLAQVEGWFRPILALGMGGFAFLWRGLTAAGLIQETALQPSWLWFPLALFMPGSVFLFILLLSRPPNPRYAVRRMLERQSQAQGRVTAEEIAEKHEFKQGVPLVQVTEGQEKKLIGLDYEKAEGHVMVVAPTRAGKGLHLTDTLRHYPGATLVIDPKGEQFERTAGLRQKLGPVYRIPGHQVHLSAYYDYLRDQDRALELHGHFMRPEDSREPIFAEKAAALFMAIGRYATAVRRNPIRLLLDLAESNIIEALTAMRAVPEARRYVDIFTNGAAPKDYAEDRFVTSALGNFTTRLAPYQKHVDTIAPPDFSRDDLIIPHDWPARNGTVYINYDLNDLRAVGGVVAAIIAAFVRHQMQPHLRDGRQKLLVAIDELPAVGLRNIADFLATGGSYGITLLLYLQSVAQLQARYDRDVTRAILSNCDHQLWYPAAELETAGVMSELYGTTMQANPMQSLMQGARQARDREGRPVTQTRQDQSTSWQWRQSAALTPNEMMALPEDQVLVTTLADRRYVFIGQRLNSIHLFNQLPGADRLNIPEPVYGRREYMDWKAATPPGAEEADSPEVDEAAANNESGRPNERGKTNRRPGPHSRLA